MLVEERRVAHVHPERGEDRVLVREGVPAEGDEVEHETLGCDPRLLRRGRERVDRLLDGEAEEPRDAAPLAESLALDEPSTPPAGR